ncbi:hypothetical protein EJ08DRAFT_663232 [Tothia fuscella]|uniref:Uncharacterized protein n=1 Tax=Tothia fuscella TaxID=1048955 RepID=A0A9P4TW00_9PEZI|nr:hypothetical protein EJ08DRAFT_663232 [Tothia fuscella]
MGAFPSEDVSDYRELPITTPPCWYRVHAQVMRAEALQKEESQKNASRQRQEKEARRKKRTQLKYQGLRRKLSSSHTGRTESLSKEPQQIAFDDPTPDGENTELQHEPKLNLASNVITESRIEALASAKSLFRKPSKIVAMIIETQEQGMSMGVRPTEDRSEPGKAESSHYRPVSTASYKTPSEEQPLEKEISVLKEDFRFNDDEELIIPELTALGKALALAVQLLEDIARKNRQTGLEPKSHEVFVFTCSPNVSNPIKEVSTKASENEDTPEDRLLEEIASKSQSLHSSGVQPQFRWLPAEPSIRGMVRILALVREAT